MWVIFFCAPNVPSWTQDTGTNITRCHLCFILTSQPLPLRPTPLVLQSTALRRPGWDVLTTRCCMSLQVRFMLHRHRQEGRANGIDFLSCNNKRYYFLHYAHYEISQVTLTYTVQQYSRGKVRSNGIWKRSGVCRHTWNVIGLSIYSEDSHEILYWDLEGALRGMSVKQNKDIGSHYGFNTGAEHQY